MTKYIRLLLVILFINQVHALTIAEKKAGLSNGGTDLNTDLYLFLTQVNRELIEAQTTLKVLYGQVAELYKNLAPEESYKTLLLKINEVKQNIDELERGWREMSIEASHEEAYALWHQPETTLAQLVMDYSSFNYVYLIPPDVADVRINVDSNLPIPRASWEEMLELILKQNGVGINQLNPYLRELYFLSENNSNINLITKNRKELDLYPSNARVCFVLSPEPADVRRTWVFLEKFANPNTTVLHSIGRDIFILAQVSDILDLLKLYDFVAQNRGDNDYRVIPLWKVDASEMAHILGTILDQHSVEAPPPKRPPRLPPTLDKRKGRPEMEHNPRDYKEIDTSNGLKIIPVLHIANALLLVGTREEIRKAEEIICEIEGQVGGAREKQIYWYTAKHSDAEELADILYRIYLLMIETNTGGENAEGPNSEQGATARNTPPIPPPEGGLTPPPPIPPPDNGFFLPEQFVINSSPSAGFGAPERLINQRSNFIVDLKTGAIVMVVEADILPKMKELIYKLDVPKKMVQLEVLLFEKRVNKEDTFGLNLLRIGKDHCINKNTGGFSFNDILPLGAKEILRANSGVTQFFLSRKETSSGIPAFDFLYKFLLSRQDVQINASPSVITVNQTPAKIAIEEEISVSTGIFEVPTPVGGTAVALKDSFARARYGIKIEITPTIHMRDNNEEYCFDDSPNYVTLVSDIAFETIQNGGDSNRPDVTRRVINNTAIVPDGQTIILGGLRRKKTTDAKESIPYFGELPGIGKLFSFTELEEETTEMFIFITPKIISAPEEELKCLRSAEMCRRPGDIPEFLCQLVAAREREKERLLEGTMTMLFGREPDRCVCAPEGEYDGR